MRGTSREPPQQTPTLDDRVIETLAELYATPAPLALRDRMLSEAQRLRTEARAAAVAHRWRLGTICAATAALTILWIMSRAAPRSADVNRLAAANQRLAAAHAELAKRLQSPPPELEKLARANDELTARLNDRNREIDELTRANADLLGRIDQRAPQGDGMGAARAPDKLLRLLGDRHALVAELAPMYLGTHGSGRVVLQPESGEVGAVTTETTPAAGAGRVYQLWAVRGDRPPETVGPFDSASDGIATAYFPRIPRPAEVTGFFVTLEPIGGSTEPKGQTVLVGPVVWP